MDISVLASVGSFWFSERILKPKASVLLILGCILAYDLTTKTHDVTSLRVYRGELRIFSRLFQSFVRLACCVPPCARIYIFAGLGLRCRFMEIE
jgi:hypothetical protein